MKKHLLFFTLVMMAGQLFADEVKFIGEAPGVVKVSQQFRLTYTVNAQADGFEAPEIGNFTVLAGPATSTSTNLSIINGKRTRTYQLKYTYILQANKTGKFTIPKARINVDGKIYSSNPVHIEVIAKQGDSGTKSGQSSSGQTETGRSQVSNADRDKLFVRILINKRNVYREEPLVATIKIYSKLNISGFENVEFPNFEGFYKQEIETAPLRQLEKENVNGEIYGTGVLKKYLLFPQKTGPITISPFVVDCIVQKKVNNRSSRSLFDDFFGNYKNVRMHLKSDPVQINVSELPSGKSPYFTGGVGSFQMDATLDKQSVKTNEGVTLKVKISGSGNLKVLEPPEISFPPDLEVYDPKISDNINVSEGGASGTKTIEYLIIPRHAGNYRIPSIQMAYFDPGAGKFKTLSTRYMSLEVAKGKGDTTTGMSATYSKKDVSIIGSDIRYIQTGNVHFREKGEYLFGSAGFYAVYVVGMLVFLFTFFFRRKKVRENADVALMKNKKASKFARQRLKIASRFLKEGEKDKFYEETLKALWGYLSDKLGIAIADLSRDKAMEKLGEKQVPEDLTEQLIELIDNCEFARYAPSGGVEKMDEFYNQSISVISRLHQKLK